MTFRAKVHDRAQATAREAITHIEQWITSSDVVTLPVHHARLNVNNTCVVLLASFDDPECPGYLTPPSVSTNDMTTSDSLSELTTAAQPTVMIMSSPGNEGEVVSPIDTRQSQFDAGAIVGGAVAIVLTICITTGVVILMFLLYSIFKVKHTGTMKKRYN